MNAMRPHLARLSHATFHRRLLVPVLAAALGAAFLTSSLAGAEESTVQSILQIEQVKARLASMPSLVQQVAQSAKSNGLNGVSELQPLVEKAAASAFNSDAMEARISKALAQTARAGIDPSALTKAAQSLALAQQKFNDATAHNSVETKSPTSQLEDSPKIEALAKAMASPDLAAETAFTQQVMYVALEALTNSTADQLTAMPLQGLNAQMKGVVEQLRQRSSNEKPIPKDVAQALEKNRLTTILAAIPHEDLQVLADFYAGAGGKAKRDALVTAYRDASEMANTQFLETYFRLLVEQLKSNPRQQQN